MLRTRAKLLLLALWIALKAAAVGLSVLASGCVTRDKLVLIETAKDGEQGINGNLSVAGQTGTLSGIGRIVTVPKDYAGPIPPDWTQEGRPFPVPAAEEPPE